MKKINWRDLHLQTLNKKSIIYFLNIFLKIYLAIINVCLIFNLRFNMYFGYNISLFNIPI
ncbi:hypothetical protein CQZ91_03405 [Bacillus cereus]|uniref:Uncharacterized protein n=1 Tax=Bacillus thuringiensis TaxID=1428 RepID=A0A4Y8T1V2_BACTU|nr:hypothetical protein B7P25_12150 [Bacillus thuringiensis]AUD25795.1 hypothetical protein CU648_26510 [Bacillus sp. HBCD-sjtu]AXO98369.1 hypothetical protein DY470_11785 [Bacillus anthracis]KAA0750663.1 hypothetical protein DN397_14670 [Bacillus sp. AY1-10]KAA2393619.1 hypothetical protein F2Y18_18725 [Bacillus cereus]KAB7638095.1 hypothetical protein GBN83_17040 [Bacillus sp. B3-WWTP-C-10-D-3]OTX36816.1 hypothetical protein BK720_05700 [Bacillus thuringiensis serovar brasilensis]RSC61095.